jgi:hypothetical protein
MQSKNVFERFAYREIFQNKLSHIYKLSIKILWKFVMSLKKGCPFIILAHTDTLKVCL